MDRNANIGQHGRLWTLAVCAASLALLVTACQAGPPASPASAATTTTSPLLVLSQPPVATPSATPEATPILTPAPPTPQPSPTPPSGPAANDETLAAVYAALRPANLRSAIGPRAFARGSQVQLAYEILNTSESSLVVPKTVFADRAASWLGVMQTWIERLGSDPGLSQCLPAAVRSGARYAIGGLPAALWGAPISIAPGQGQTLRAVLAAQYTSCFPVGRYRYTLEYRKIQAAPTADPISRISIDIELRQPTSWSVQAFAAASIQGKLTMQTQRAGRSVIDLSGLQPGVKYTYEVRAGCDRDAPLIVGPVTFKAAANGARHDARTLSLSTAARKALAAGRAPGLWTFVSNTGYCTRYLGASSAIPAGRAPTTWGGRFLREPLGDGFTVTASSEFIRPGDGGPTHAFDGDPNLTWNSGAGPTAWIELDMGRNRPVEGLRLLPSQSPDGQTVHRIYGRADGSATEVLLATLDGITHDNIWIDARFAKTKSIRYIRIETASSPSWVAWREILVTGVELPKVNRLPVGYHDGTTLSVAHGAQCYANGWSSDPDGATSVRVRVLVDGSEVWWGTASLERPDVQAAGAGNRNSGFQVGLGRYMPTGSHEIRVQAQDLETGTWVDLGGTPRTLACP